MKRTPEGLSCPKCGKLVRLKPVIKENNAKKPSQDAIYVVDGPEDNYVKAIRLCPNCGNGEAFHWSSTAIGEHAGVRQERTIEHFRCTKCMHTWVESS
jgi:DNA-directed RNA polymerase subunit M/transcription elongation factor TFIIS